VETALRITIMGTGGVGGYFGARLAHAGHEVSFVARGRQLAALQAGGLRVLSPLGDLHLPRVRAIEHPAQIGQADLVIFGVKLWDTVAAAESMRSLVGEHTAVVSFQNGVVKDDLLRQALGPRALAGGVCYIASTIAEPGVIRHTGAMQKLVFGEFDGMRSERLQRFAAACAEAGIDHELSTDIRMRQWEKFVFLVGLSGATTTMRVPVGVLRDEPRARVFMRDLMHEVVQVARAEGVALPPDYAENRLAFADGLPPTMTSSMHHDLDRGGRLEVPWLAGDVVARGQKLGVPTPCNRAVADILAVHAAGRAG